jgi:hypothetical protein
MPLLSSDLFLEMLEVVVERFEIVRRGVRDEVVELFFKLELLLLHLFAEALGRSLMDDLEGFLHHVFVFFFLSGDLRFLVLLEAFSKEFYSAGAFLLVDFSHLGSDVAVAFNA